MRIFITIICHKQKIIDYFTKSKKYLQNVEI